MTWTYSSRVGRVATWVLGWASCTAWALGTLIAAHASAQTQRVAVLKRPSSSPVPSPQPEPSYDTEPPKPPPLHISYASYGVAVAADVLAHAGATCRVETDPCILGSGGGLVLRGGYRSPGPWYVGGAYQFTTTDSNNLYRLAVLQQLRAEMRYMLDMGFRTSPYATWGLGAVVYGNEWGVETGGGTIFAGLGAEIQLSRLALLGVSANYQPVLFAGWTDTANFERSAGVAHFVRIELQVEIRSELTRR
jgi:hypothetical protein